MQEFVYLKVENTGFKGVGGGVGVKVYYYLYIEATLGEKAIVYAWFIYSKLNPKQTLQILVFKYKCI